MANQKVKKLMPAILLAVCLTGCYNGPLKTYDLTFDRFYTTTLKLSTSADVLAVAQTTQDPDTELLSQSESLIALWGKQGHKDRTHWFNLVAFDEEASTAVRKYAFILEETTRGINRTPKPGLRFDGELVMDSDILDAAYANNNEKQIAVLKAVQDAFNLDAAELTFDSAVLTSSTMMVQQAMNGALNHLNRSPAFAAHLARPEGMAFDHITLGESYIRLLIEGDSVKVKIKAGKAWFHKYWLIDKPFEEHPDVRYM
jgi:hypothetical protein